MDDGTTTTEDPGGTRPKPFAFTLMPFVAEFDDVYKLAIKPACEAAGAYCERVDEQMFEESILQRIYNQLAKADVVIADLSERNPNVFYETGYAHALGKPVILLTRSASDIPFDLKHHHHIIYGSSLSHLRDELEIRVRWYLEISASSHGILSSSEQLVFYADKQEVREGAVVHVEGRRLEWEVVSIPFGVVFQNASPRIYRGYDQLGFIVPEAVELRDPDSERPNEGSVPLPDERILILYRDLPRIYPKAWESVRFEAVFNPIRNPELVEGIPMTIRMFTPVGPRDMNITLRLADRDHEEKDSAEGRRDA
ncbi:MAG: nucleoside 2-deoxyribosyltransferase [Gemmatimonadota bacterium]